MATYTRHFNAETRRFFYKKHIVSVSEFYMGYDSYGRDSYGEYGNYGEYGRGSYGRRGRDMKYRGDDSLDRMSGEYGRYMENRNRYGASQETDRSYFSPLKDHIL